MRFLRAFLFANIWSAVVPAAKVTFRNKHYYYFDVDGNAIDSTNGKVEWVRDQYFWIGEPDSCSTAVCDKVSYSSSDLINWYFNGPLFNITEPVNAAACSGFGSCSRPKVAYNEKTKKYVFYGYASSIAGAVGIPVFTSDELTKGYTFVGKMIPDYAPSGYGVEDLGLTVIDSKGYVIWTGFNLTETLLGAPISDIWPPFIQTVLIQELTADFLNGTGKAYPVIQDGGDFPVEVGSTNFVDGQVESPDLFKRGDYYYVVGSATCSFCAGTLTIAYRSTSLHGPWTRQIVDSNNTCGGQAMGVMTVPPVDGSQPTFVYHADAFHTAPVGQHFTASKGHSFWSLSFAADGSIEKIDCSPITSYTIDVPPANVSIPSTGRATNETDGSGNRGDYWSETGLSTKQFLYQTWTSSKSGNLSEIGVNLASNAPTSNPLTITVFSYHNESEFISPYFKWTTLASTTIGEVAGTVAPAFKVQRVAVGKTVQAGQKLGIALTVPGHGPAQNSLPYAYLLQDTSQIEGGTDHVLYYLTRGHVSVDGLGAAQSPVKVMEGTELKWYAIVD